MESFNFIASDEGNILKLLIRCFFQSRNIEIFSYFPKKTYVVGPHYRRLAKMLLMSTRNIGFRGEIRKIFT